MIDGLSFHKDKYGFWRQDNPLPINYSIEYKNKQSTTVEMSWLRIGWFLSVVSGSVKELLNWRICDVGSGNGNFAKVASNVFGKVKEYDLSGDTISKDELLSTEWDLIVLSDVLEHFEDINSLFDIKFEYLLLSFPETPAVTDWHKLSDWRHFKPNEHIYNLNMRGCNWWLEDNGYDIIRAGHIEDTIRKSDRPYNISSIVAKKRLSLYK